jgi:signal peptidase I
MLLARFKVIGHSMQPQIVNGETVLISNLFYLFKNPQIGDIVAFSIQGKILIKRYFLEGDNREDSLDSRKFGFVLREKILGKVFYKL